MMELFRHELEDATLISVGHRPELEEFHERKLTLQRHPSQARPQTSARSVAVHASCRACCAVRCGRGHRPIPAARIERLEGCAVAGKNDAGTGFPVPAERGLVISAQASDQKGDANPPKRQLRVRRTCWTLMFALLLAK